ncbi:MAG TPA: hypothetical protein VH134_11500 [Candidatus Dormibacteraeota bacterium]|nr:hypothetical protein [Candidatus Dormibacteraeota bacterium]
MPTLRHPTRAQTLTLGALAVLAAASPVAAVALSHHSARSALSAAAVTPLPPAPPPPATAAPEAPLATAVPVATAAPPPPAAAPPAPARPAAAAGLTMAGCPPPPAPPPRSVPPWHPAVLVPESALPPPAPADAPAASLDALSGKGMWVWQYRRTEGGDPQAIVDRAAAAGLHQIWVRVADSQDGFYGDDELSAIVPRAHRRGIDVVAWGFPHLYDPVADAAWSKAVLDWRATSGDRVDGFSADIEMASEGVALTPRRAALYLSLVRQARDGRPLIATVYPPTDHFMAAYPFAAMAPYIDAYAPMEYWECRDPGAAAAEAIARLAKLRPVHLIGQAFSFGDVAGRVDLPSAAELERFMAVCRSRGAVGVSFWVWQSMTAAEWAELTAFPWVR